MPTSSGKQIVNVLIKIIIKKFKKEEFLDSTHIYEAKIRNQPGFMSFNIYQDADDENTCQLLGEWKSAQAMEKHFKTHEFELLLAAVKVLCESFEIETTKVLHIGDLDWARRQNRLRRKTNESKIQ